MTKQQNKKPRPYKRITPAAVAKHRAAVALTGNNTAAARVSDPEYTSPEDRGYRLAKKSEQMPTLEYLDNGLQQIAASGVRRMHRVIEDEATDERLAFNITKYATDQVRGKAISKSISVTQRISIESALD